jgi:hypothetical protein
LGPSIFYGEGICSYRRRPLMESKGQRDIPGAFI